MIIIIIIIKLKKKNIYIYIYNNYINKLTVKSDVDNSSQVLGILLKGTSMNVKQVSNGYHTTRSTDSTLTCHTCVSTRMRTVVI